MVNDKYWSIDTAKHPTLRQVLHHNKQALTDSNMVVTEEVKNGVEQYLTFSTKQDTFSALEKAVD